MEIINAFQRENHLIASKEEKKVADVIHQEGDRNQDGRLTANELYQLLLGQNPPDHDTPSEMRKISRSPRGAKVKRY